MFLWPLSIIKGKLEFTVTNLHSAEIKQIETTCDKNYLITISKDASIYLCNMKYYQESSNKSYNDDLLEENNSCDYIDYMED